MSFYLRIVKILIVEDILQLLLRIVVELDLSRLYHFQEFLVCNASEA